ncbi:hypothetical protein HaLaN_30544, partial [Haematococcus lacustris]
MPGSLPETHQPGPEGVVYTPLADRIASLGSSILASLKEKALALDGTSPYSLVGGLDLLLP